MRSREVRFVLPGPYVAISRLDGFMHHSLAFAATGIGRAGRIISIRRSEGERKSERRVRDNAPYLSWAPGGFHPQWTGLSVAAVRVALTGCIQARVQG